MRASGEREIGIILSLNSSDPKDRKHCIRMIDHFDYNKHLCLVFECMDINLRETLAKYGNGVGLSLEGVCSYGR